MSLYAGPRVCDRVAWPKVEQAFHRWSYARSSIKRLGPLFTNMFVRWALIVVPAGVGLTSAFFWQVGGWGRYKYDIGDNNMVAAVITILMACTLTLGISIGIHWRRSNQSERRTRGAFWHAVGLVFTDMKLEQLRTYTIALVPQVSQDEWASMLSYGADLLAVPDTEKAKVIDVTYALWRDQSSSSMTGHDLIIVARASIARQPQEVTTCVVEAESVTGYERHDRTIQV